MTQRPTFEDIFENELAFVHRSLARFGVREADLPDVTQDVFLTVLEILPDYDPGRPLRPWLFAIAYRFALRYRDKASTRREVFEEPDASRPTAAPSPEQQMSAEEARALALVALSRIEPRKRAVFVMVELEEMAVPQVAEALGIPLNTAYSRLRLARDDFREAVEELGGRP